MANDNRGIAMANKASERQDDLKRRRASPLVTPTDLGAQASKEIAGGMNGILPSVASTAADRSGAPFVPRSCAGAGGAGGVSTAGAPSPGT